MSESPGTGRSIVRGASAGSARALDAHGVAGLTQTDGPQVHVVVLDPGDGRVLEPTRVLAAQP